MSYVFKLGFCVQISREFGVAGGGLQQTEGEGRQHHGGQRQWK